MLPCRVLLLLPLIATIAASTQAAGADVVLAVKGLSNQTPWAAASGQVVAVAWGATAPTGGADVFVAVSRDSGGTFGAPVRVNTVEGEARLGGELPPRVAIVPAAPGAEPEIVVAFGAKASSTEIRVSRSRDGGRTFDKATALQAPGAPGDRGWHAMTLDAAGAAHVMWLDHRGLAAQKAQGHEHHEAAAMDGAAMAQHSGLYYARAGAAVSPEREVTKGVCYCCKVAMSTTPDGAIVAAWRHVYPGNVRDIAFTVSRDAGASFAPPARVSTDEWQLAGCPDDGPAMAVDRTGTVHVIWPTVIGGETPEGALFYAFSKDGRTFSARQRVPTLGSPRPMHPQIVVDAAGRISVAWDEVLGGVRQAAVRPLTLDRDGRAAFGDPVWLGMPGRTSSYPLLVATSRGLLAVYVNGKAGQSTIVVRPL